jgi:hypothetical protein
MPSRPTCGMDRCHNPCGCFFEPGIKLTRSGPTAQSTLPAVRMIALRRRILSFWLDNESGRRSSLTPMNQSCRHDFGQHFQFLVSHSGWLGSTDSQATHGCRACSVSACQRCAPSFSSSPSPRGLSMCVTGTAALSGPSYGALGPGLALIPDQSLISERRSGWVAAAFARPLRLPACGS